MTEKKTFIEKLEEAQKTDIERAKREDKKHPGKYELLFNEQKELNHE